MIAEKMMRLGEKRSSIREAYEYGRQRAALIGEENVFDFSRTHMSQPRQGYAGQSGSCWNRKMILNYSVIRRPRDC